MRFTLVFLTAFFCLTAKAESDEALVAAAEKLIAEAQANGLTTEPILSENKSESASEPVPSSAPALKESEIPVVMSAPKAEKSDAGNLWRLLASIAFIATVGGALVFSTRRWSQQKDKGGKQARIEIMHQMHLGPRKSLALVRVAGEVMVVGITDHNINMLKSVTLIDDELANVVNKDFNGFLEDEFSISDVRSVIGSRT